MRPSFLPVSADAGAVSGLDAFVAVPHQVAVKVVDEFVDALVLVVPVVVELLFELTVTPHRTHHGQRQRADRVRLVHHQHHHWAMLQQLAKQGADLRLLLVGRSVDDAVAMPVERARVRDCLSTSRPRHVEAVVSHDGPPCLAEDPRPPRGMANAGPDARSRQPHYDKIQRFTHVNFRPGRVTISGKQTSRSWQQHPQIINDRAEESYHDRRPDSNARIYVT